MSSSYAKIRPKRSSKTEWELINPILLAGELGVEYPDTGLGTGLVKIKIGDGLTAWNDLKYAINPSSATSIYGGDAKNSHDIWLRSDTNANWIATDPILGLGETVYDQTYRCYKTGDSVHKYSELPFIGLEKSDYDFDFGDEDDNTNESDNNIDFGENE